MIRPQCGLISFTPPPCVPLSSLGLMSPFPPLSHKVALSSNVTDDPKTLLKGKKYFYKCRILAYTISSLLKMEGQERIIFVRV